jgi:hypothetical protein
MEDECKNEPFADLPEDPKLFRHDHLAVDGYPRAHSFHRRFVRSERCRDVIFLGKFVSRVHDPIRDIAIIREKQ